MFEKVKEIIVDQINCDESAVKLETKLIDDLGIDSLDIAELVMEIEDNFDITVDESDYEKLVSVKNIVDYIEEKSS